MKNILLIFLCFGWYLPLFAQNTADTLLNYARPVVPRLLEISVSANTYRGELSTYRDWSASFHAAIRFNQERKVNHRIGIGSGFITGNDRFYTFRDNEGNLTTPNTFFRTRFLSLIYELEYNLIHRRNFRLYLSQGLGLMRFEPQNSSGQNLLDLTETRPFDESYGNFTLQLPTGIGAIYLFRNGFGLGAYLGFMNTQTDYLDNISAWSTKIGNDNILSARFSFLIPLKILPILNFPQRRKYEFYPYETTF